MTRHSRIALVVLMLAFVAACDNDPKRKPPAPLPDPAEETTTTTTLFRPQTPQQAEKADIAAQSLGERWLRRASRDGNVSIEALPPEPGKRQQYLCRVQIIEGDDSQVFEATNYPSVRACHEATKAAETARPDLARKVRPHAYPKEPAPAAN